MKTLTTCLFLVVLVALPAPTDEPVAMPPQVFTVLLSQQAPLIVKAIFFEVAVKGGPIGPFELYDDFEPGSGYWPPTVPHKEGDPFLGFNAHKGKDTASWEREFLSEQGFPFKEEDIIVLIMTEKGVKPGEGICKLRLYPEGVVQLSVVRLYIPAIPELGVEGAAGNPTHLIRIVQTPIKNFKSVADWEKELYKDQIKEGQQFSPVPLLVKKKANVVICWGGLKK